jgi:hypothetical protein
MKPETKIQRWIPSLMTAVALAGSASLCQAQAPIIYDFASDLQGWYGTETLPMAATYSWNPTGGSGGGGCMQVVMDGVTTTEIDPRVTLPSTLDQAQYLSVSIHMKVDPGSGVTGTAGSGGNGNLQAVFLDASYGWHSIWYGPLYPPASHDWVTYTFVIPQPYRPAEQYLGFQLQGSAGYTAPVTVYVDNVTITPVPNPWLKDAFTDSSIIGSGLDTAVDAPFVDPVTPGAPTTVTPAGSWKIQISNPNGYSGWNQYQPPSTFDTTRYEKIGFDVYYDGPDGGGTQYGGFQFFLFNNGWSAQWAGAVSFNASMIGKWTHFDLPCAASGITACPALVFQGAPGAGGANPITFHVDNIVLWNAVTRPKITALTPNTEPGGLKIAVDANGTSNPNDQEGISSPSAANAQTNFFWIGQTPATYSFTLTNFPVPAAPFSSTPTVPESVGSGFDAHIYLCNGDSIEAFSGAFAYNQTYSGAPYNLLDYLGLHVQNAFITNAVTYTTNEMTMEVTTNNSYSLGSGVVAILDWKTNAPNANATNRIVFDFPAMASANGTWSLNFSDNTHGSIVAADGSVNAFTLPDFLSDPNYAANFTPVTSMVQFGVFKNGNNANNSLSAIFTHVLVTNNVAGTIYDDNFNGPGLTAKYAWQVAQYYLNPANRTLWIPQGTAYWLKWDTTQSGFVVQSTGDLLGTWGNAGVNYTYSDGTGTNTIGAVPAASLPSGNAGFFQLKK